MAVFGKEPAAVFGGLAEIFRQLIPLLIVFGFIHWTDIQIAAAFAFSSVVLSFGTVLLTRSQTVPTQVVNSQIETAVRMPVGTSVEDVVKKEARDSK